MNLIQALIDRFFHGSVDSILSGVNKSIARLERLEKRKAEEAEAHQAALNESERARDAAKSEAARAVSTRTRFKDLIGA
jgi:hypothetical protein